MEKQIPKAIKVEMVATILRVTFDNGEIRYLKSHFNQEYVDAFSLNKGKKRALLLTSPQTTWLGTTVKINEDGSVILNEKDNYTPVELWNNSKRHVDAL